MKSNYSKRFFFYYKFEEKSQIFDNTSVSSGRTITSLGFTLLDSMIILAVYRALRRGDTNTTSIYLSLPRYSFGRRVLRACSIPIGVIGQSMRFRLKCSYFLASSVGLCQSSYRSALLLNSDSACLIIRASKNPS